MSRHQKLIERLKSKPKNFKYAEVVQLLKGFGYEESTKGKTSGSAVAFVNRETKQVIRIHKPHPQNEVKLYVINLLLNHLKELKLI